MYQQDFSSPEGFFLPNILYTGDTSLIKYTSKIFQGLKRQFILFTIWSLSSFHNAKEKKLH